MPDDIRLLPDEAATARRLAKASIKVLAGLWLYLTTELTAEAIYQEIACILLPYLGPPPRPPPDPADAAWALALHCARVDQPPEKVRALLIHCASEVPLWPDDPEEIEAIISVTQKEACDERAG